VTTTKPATTHQTNQWLTLSGFLFVCYAVAAVGTISAIPNIPTWYAALNKPSFNPNWIFGQVWTLLYGLMAIAAWLIWRTPRSGPYASQRLDALLLFAAQLTLNFLWTPVFFHFHHIFVAFVIIILLWIAILLTILRFWPIDSFAAVLLLPYLAWVSFATALNYEICRLN
jgi:tryptophan-rich sensory protein